MEIARKMEDENLQFDALFHISISCCTMKEYNVAMWTLQMCLELLPSKGRDVGNGDGDGDGSKSSDDILKHTDYDLKVFDTIIFSFIKSIETLFPLMLWDGTS